LSGLVVEEIAVVGVTFAAVVGLEVGIAAETVVELGVDSALFKVKDI